MPTDVTPTAVTAAHSDDNRRKPGSSPAVRKEPARHRTSPTSLWSTTALLLWLVYLVIVVALPDADLLRRASTTPVLVLAGAWLIALLGWVAAARSLPASSAARSLAHFLPWINAAGVWFIVWQLTTSKLGLLTPPYFAAPEVLIASFAGDWRLLLSCLGASALLFVIGYSVGSLLGFLTGLLMGWSRRADYWLHPLLQTIGPVPAASLLPLALLLLPTTYASAAFIVGFGAWFPMATMTRAGVRSVRRDYIDMARTLGADELFLIRRVAVPSALPDMLTGLFTGLGTSLAALMTAELTGVDKGLAWYINWVKGWADYPRMYVGLIILVAFCRTLMVLLFKIRSSLLAWQQNLVRW
ncbi:ABC transporter permease subunit [Actinomyces viscosus]|uniref:Bicarbonate transport system permease protein CmpB n=1 Tax=Actinomyces viscosus TaxID=1656 RepID=A0A3S4Z0I5_ACTVI|nr:ABC transporter permease subunit [Actinomyces viscosus]TFH52903.1 ABC transporter permease subunit [Actinomyces viscosus]VEI14818.1 Bicarbonate transport system permease protein CmpB [Actinomyces viscosus]